MKIRCASGQEMLALWGYDGAEEPTPTARFFYDNIASDNAIFYALEEGGEMIGELYAFKNIPEDKDFADGVSTVYLCAFRIRKDHRGKGLGTFLMTTVLAEIKKTGFKRATIGVDEEANERLYRRLGFSEKVKEVDFDPCARDTENKPLKEGVFTLLAKNF